MSNHETLKSMIERSVKLQSNFKAQKDQSKVTIYKAKEMFIYHVTVNIDRETYLSNNSENFYSSEPILPKEHLRIQQLMVREERTRCIFCITFRDIAEEPEMIIINRDILLHEFLSSENI